MAPSRYSFCRGDEQSLRDRSGKSWLLPGVPTTSTNKLFELQPKVRQKATALRTPFLISLAHHNGILLPHSLFVKSFFNYFIVQSKVSCFNNLTACSHQRSSISMPIHLRPKSFAARNVDPAPQNGSRTVPLDNINTDFNILTGFSCGCRSCVATRSTLSRCMLMIG